MMGTAKRLQNTGHGSYTAVLSCYFHRKTIGGDKNMIGKNGLRTAGATVAVMLMLLGVFAIPASVSAAPVTVSSKLTTDTGTTTDFGGGDFFYVRFGADAAFGIVWGTDTTLNNVYFVAIKARYLGMAQVYDTQGTMVEANHTVKIYTVYAVKLEDIFEYNDSIDNGIFQGHRTYANGNFTGNYVHNEDIYKKVDLKTAWDQSLVTYAETDDTRTWSFDLTAKDRPYTTLDNYTGSTGDNKLNDLKLTFHLSAKMVQVDNATIPQWRITVQRGTMGGMMDNMMGFNDAQRMDDYRVSGKIITYNVKWDQSIEGWDFDAADSNPTLLMEFGAIVGNYIPRGMVSWMGWNMLRAMNENGTMTCRSTSGDVSVDQTTGTYSTPKPLSAPALTFGGDKTRIGAFEWISNVTVDGNQEQLHSQIMGGVPVWSVAMNGAVFAGFAVLGGISYPGGAMIVHDPTFSSDALVDVGGTNPRAPVFLFVVGAIIAMVVAITIVAVIMMEKKPGQKAQQSYERKMSSQPGEWAKYYDKK
jgi:hypothetical protein